MGLYKLSVNIHYWLGSGESSNKKTIEIYQDHFANTESAASLKLNKILLNRMSDLGKQGFSVRYDNWNVRQM